MTLMKVIEFLRVYCTLRFGNARNVKSSWNFIAIIALIVAATFKQFVAVEATTTPSTTSSQTAKSASSSLSRKLTATSSFSNARSQSWSITHSFSASHSLTPSQDGTTSTTPSKLMTPSMTQSISRSKQTLSPSFSPTVSVTRIPSSSETHSFSLIPTPSKTYSSTPSWSLSLSLSMTVTPPPTPTMSETVTPPPTPTSSFSGTLSPTTTVTPPPTPTSTTSVTVTPPPTRTASNSSTVSFTITPPPTSTPSISVTVTPPPTRTATVSPSPTFSPTVTPPPTRTASFSHTASAPPTRTMSFSRTITPTVTPAPTQTPTSSVSTSTSTSVSPTTTFTPSLSLSVSYSATDSKTTSTSASTSSSVSVTPAQTRTDTGSRSSTTSVSPSVSASQSRVPTESPTVSPSLSTPASPSVSAPRTPSLTFSVTTSRSPSASTSSTTSVSQTASLTVSMSQTTSWSRSQSVTVSATSTESRSLSSSQSLSASKTPSTTSSWSQPKTRSMTFTMSPSRSKTVSKSTTLSFFRPEVVPLNDTVEAVAISEVNFYKNSTRRIMIEFGGGDTIDLTNSINRSCIESVSAIHTTGPDDMFVRLLVRAITSFTHLVVLNKSLATVEIPSTYPLPFILYNDATVEFQIDSECTSRRTQNLGFNVTIARTPPPPTPAPPLPESPTLRGSRIGATVVTLGAGAAGAGAAGAQLSRSSMVLNMIECTPEAGPLEFAEAPLAFNFDDSREAYYISGSFMNVVLLVLLGALQLLASLIYAKVKKCGFSEGMHCMRFPSLLVFPTMLLLEPTMMCAVVSIVHGSPTAKGIGSLVVIICVSVPVASVVYLKRTFKAEFVDPWDDPERINVVVWFLFGNNKWVDEQPPEHSSAQGDSNDDPKKVESGDGSVVQEPFTGWHGYVQKHRLFFEDYRKEFFFFITCEMTMSLICGFLDGLKLGSGKCDELLIISTLLFAFFLMALLATRPFSAPFLMVFTITLTSLQLLGAIFVTIRVFTGDVDYEDAAENTTLVCLYMLTIRSVYDVSPVLKKLYRKLRGYSKYIPRRQQRRYSHLSNRSLDSTMDDVSKSLLKVHEEEADDDELVAVVSDVQLSLDELDVAVAINPASVPGRDDFLAAEAVPETNSEVLQCSSTEDPPEDDTMETFFNAAELDEISTSQYEPVEIATLETKDHNELLALVADKVAELQLHSNFDSGELSRLSDQQDYLRNVDLADDATYVPGQDDELILVLRSVHGPEAAVLRQRLLERKYSSQQKRRKSVKAIDPPKGRVDAQLDDILADLDNFDDQQAFTAVEEEPSFLAGELDDIFGARSDYVLSNSPQSNSQRTTPTPPNHQTCAPVAEHEEDFGDAELALL